MRNNFNVSAITNLPKGFKINPIFVARSGMPYTPIIGFDTQNDGNDWNDRAIVNNKVVARNSARQPSFFNLDLRFVKDFALRGEGRHLDLFMDIFNIIGTGNRNFGPEAVSVFGTTAAPYTPPGRRSSLLIPTILVARDRFSSRCASLRSKLTRGLGSLLLSFCGTDSRGQRSKLAVLERAVERG